MNSRSSGFAVVGIMIVAILAIVIVGGYLYFSKHTTSTNLTQQTNDTTSKTYSNSTDLNQATASLDNTDVDANLDNSLKQLDAEANNF